MIRVRVGNIRTLIRSMNQRYASFSQALDRCIEAGGEVMLAEIRATASRNEHTLDDLARKDHPYARRHGAIQASTLGGAFVQRPYLVHVQSGGLLRSIQGRFSRPGGLPLYAVGSDHPHAAAVIDGSRHLLRRDFMIDTMNERRVQRDVLRAMVRVLGQELRTQATIRGVRHAVAPSQTEA